MRDRDWLKAFIAALQDVDFETAVLFQLENIRHAEPKDRPKEAASFGGFLRSQRSSWRVSLAKALMEQLHIEPTLHVAKYVMWHAFGEAAANETLDHHFARPGRNATEKHMDEARYILTRRPDQAERYARLYAWYCRALKRKVARLKKRSTK